MPKHFDQTQKKEVLAKAQEMLDKDPKMSRPKIAETLHNVFATKMRYSDGKKPGADEFTAGTIKAWLDAQKFGSQKAKAKAKVPTVGNDVDGIDEIFEQIDDLKGKVLKGLVQQQVEIDRLQKKLDESVVRASKELNKSEADIRKEMKSQSAG